MSWFVICAAALTLLVLAVLLRPLVGSRPQPLAKPRSQPKSAGGDGPAAEQSSNLAILREHMAQLQAEQVAGTLAPGEFERARDELARRVLEENGPSAARTPALAGARSPGAAWLVGLLLPLLAAGLYARLGEPRALDLAPVPAAAMAGAAGGSAGGSAAGAAPGVLAGEAPVSMVQIEAMVAQMAERLEKMPPDQATPEGWEMLARSLAALQRFGQADQAYQRAIALAPRNPNLLADRADLLVLLQDPASRQTSERLIALALQIDAGHPKALALAASAAYERQDTAAAIGYWRRALQRAEPGSDFAKGLERSLVMAGGMSPAEAGRLPGSLPVAPSGSFSQSFKQPAPAQPAWAAQSSAARPTPAAASSVARVSGSVRLSPALRERIRPGDTVFVLARAAQGPRMPLAVLRVQAAKWPLEFVLDDSLAMSPEFSLSRFEQVVIEARVSRSGEAMTQSGDLIGRSAPVYHRTSQLEIVIDQAQP